MMFANDPELRSYDTLAASEWTDHVKHFSKLFQIKKVHSFLEFGVGEGTKYFLDNCDQVTSVELIGRRNGAPNEQYYNKCLTLFSNYLNWNPRLYRCSKAIDAAVDVAEDQRINPATIDQTYLLELKVLCDDLFKEKTYEVAFVDPGIIVRGSIVNELFGRVDIIAAHDVGFHPTIYGWEWVKTPDDYERIRFLDGSGTAFWIRKTQVEIINGLKQYPHD